MEVLVAVAAFDRFEEKLLFGTIDKAMKKEQYTYDNHFKLSIYKHVQIIHVHT